MLAPYVSYGRIKWCKRLVSTLLSFCLADSSFLTSFNFQLSTLKFQFKVSISIQSQWNLNPKVPLEPWMQKVTKVTFKNLRVPNLIFSILNVQLQHLSMLVEASWGCQAADLWTRASHHVTHVWLRSEWLRRERRRSSDCAANGAEARTAQRIAQNNMWPARGPPSWHWSTYWPRP